MLSKEQSPSDNAARVDTSGEFIGAGESKTVDQFEPSVDNYYLLGSTYARGEGQVVFQTPGRVTTIVFHATVNAARCNLAGSAVTATQP